MFLATLLVVFAVAPLSGCASKDETIVAGTGQIAELVTRLAPPGIRVHTLVPPAMCPGHYDVRPDDIQAISHARLVLIHDWQAATPGIQRTLDAAGVESGAVHEIPVQGTWMVASARVSALEEVEGLLKQTWPRDAAGIRRRAKEIREGIKRMESEAVPSFRESMNSRAPRVLCSDKQAAFAEWLGLSVAGTFGRAEDLGMSSLETLARTAKEQHVSLVIDNLQSGDTKTGAAIAREVGALHVVLSGFPGGYPGTDTWEEAVHWNMRLISDACGASRDRHVQ